MAISAENGRLMIMVVVDYDDCGGVLAYREVALSGEIIYEDGDNPIKVNNIVEV